MMRSQRLRQLKPAYSRDGLGAILAFVIGRKN